MRTLGEGLFDHFCAVAHEPPVNPSHRRATLAVHRTKGGSTEREKEGDYATEDGEDSGDDRREEGWGDDMDRSLGDGSGVNGASTTGDDESSMEGADGTTGAAEDGGEWRQVMWRRGRHGGQKVRERRQGGRSQREGDRDGAAVTTQTTQEYGNGADEARQKRARDRDSADGATETPLAVAGAEHGDDGEAAGSLWRGNVEIMRGDVTPAVMVAAAAPSGREGLPDRGGQVQWNFWS